LAQDAGRGTLALLLGRGLELDRVVWTDRALAADGEGPQRRRDRPVTPDRGPGSSCSLYVDTPAEIVEGDLIRTRAGSCYVVDRARRSPSRPGRWLLRVTRLERDSVQAGDPGVTTLRWYPRRRRAAGR
jgi:hypothetical protein